jgi:hypothetical protein
LILLAFAAITLITDERRRFARSVHFLSQSIKNKPQRRPVTKTVIVPGVKAAQVFNNIRVVKIILLDRIESFGAGQPGLVRRNIWNHDRPPGVSHERDNKVVVCTIRSPRMCGAERDSLYRARAGTDGTIGDRGRAVCERGVQMSQGRCSCTRGVRTIECIGPFSSKILKYQILAESNI